MSVLSTNKSQTTTGLNSTGPYTITIDFDTARPELDLTVTLVAPGGSESVLTYTSEYTVSGKNLYTVGIYDNTYSLKIQRTTSRIQPINYLNGQAIPAEDLEEHGFDRVVHMIQEIDGDIDTLQAQVGSGQYNDNIWAVGTTYNLNDMVNYNGVLWKSLQNSNTGNTPAEGAWWTEYSAGTDGLDGTINWSSLITYADGDCVFYSGQLYESLQDSNLNQNPATQTAYWTPLLDNIESYDTGWVSNSNWQSMSATITHNLDGDLGGLEVTFLMSATGAMSDAFKIEDVVYDSASAALRQYGVEIWYNDDNSVILHSGASGVIYFNAAGTVSGLGASSPYYYRIIIRKWPTTAIKGEKGDAGVGVAWSAATTYSTDDIVSYGNALYQSLQSSNLNQQPDTETDYWMQLAFRDEHGLCAFHAQLSGNHTTVAVIVWDDELYDVGDDYDHTTGVFTAPRDGFYIFTTGGIPRTVSLRGRWHIQKNVAGGGGWDNFDGASSSSASVYLDGDGTNYPNSFVTVGIQLTAGDQIRTYCLEDGVYGSGGYSYFAGYELTAKGIKGDPGVAMPWDDGVTYSSGNVVTYSNSLYQAIQGGNLNQNPATETAYWTEIDLLVELNAGDDDWHDVGGTGEPAFENSWVNYGGTYWPLRFRKDAAGWVHIQGMVKSGTIGQDIFQLPVGYRPDYQQLGYAITSSGMQRQDVFPDGSVNATAGSNTWYNIDCHFWVGNATAIKGEKGDPGIAATWSDATTYSEGDVITYGNKIYLSLQDSNLDQNPVTETAYWQLHNFTNIVWTSTEPGAAAMQENTLYLVYY